MFKNLGVAFLNVLSIFLKQFEVPVSYLIWTVP